MMKTVIRCNWANQSEIERDYHDTEWGIPVHDDKHLFRMLMLEGMQAGLSWVTILKKRENFYKAFDLFDPEIVMHYDAHKVEALMQDAGIIRNRLKIKAVIQNARAYVTLIEKHGSLNDFLWKHVSYQPIQNAWKTFDQVPANTPLSDEISKKLKAMGFTFVGSTIIYAFMQSIGMVNDHLINCAFYNNSLHG